MSQCKAHVSRGRACLSNCQRKAGHGPKGEYCKVHARQHSTEKAMLSLWYVGWDNDYYHVSVRSIGEKTFVDHRGRLTKLVSRSGIFYREPSEALAHIRKRLATNVASGKDCVQRAQEELAEFNRKYPK